MTDLDDVLDEAFDELGRDAPHDPALAESIRRRALRRRTTVYTPVAAAVAVLAIVGSVLIFRPHSPAPTATVPSACSPLTQKPLPTWAAAGFSDPHPSARFATGRSGSILAIVFPDALYSPPKADQGNKILWVAAPGAGGDQVPDLGVDASLHISGHLEGSTRTMTATVDGGPGPSLIDVPVAGCWQFDLRWNGHTDSLALAYQPS